MGEEKKKTLPRCSAGLLTSNSTEATNGGSCFVFCGVSQIDCSVLKMPGLIISNILVSIFRPKPAAVRTEIQYRQLAQVLEERLPSQVAK